MSELLSLTGAQRQEFSKPAEPWHVALEEERSDTWSVVDQLSLLEPRLKSGLGQQWLPGGRGDLQVELPVLCGIFIS